MMGPWGDGFFRRDAHYELLYELAEDMGVENLLCPQDSDAVVVVLNSGILAETFDDLFNDAFELAEEIVLLAAAAMELGAIIPERYMIMLRGAYPFALGIPDVMKVQFKFGLDTYKNDGNPWKVKAHRQIKEVISRGEPAADVAKKGNRGAVIYIDGKREFLPLPRPHISEHSLETLQSTQPRCWSCSRIIKTAHKCTDCSRACYCNKICKRRDHVFHSKICHKVKSA